MLSITLLATSALVIARGAQATISVTFPVGASTCTGGQPCGPIKWQIDDSIAPLGASFGETSVGIYTGSVNQQTLFLDIGTVSDPTQMMELPAVTIPADLGPNGDFYFVRFESNEALDAATGYPLQAFSAKFTLTGMTGQLSPEASAQINGAILSTADTRRLSRTAASTPGAASSTGSGRTSTGTTSTTGTPRIGSNAQATGAKNVTTDTGAASSNVKIGMATTVSLAAFMGTAAYLAL